MGEHRPSAVCGPWFLHHPCLLAETELLSLTVSKAHCEHQVLHAASSELACGSRGEISKAPRECLCFQRGMWLPNSASWLPKSLDPSLFTRDLTYTELYERGSLNSVSLCQAA